MDKKKQENQLEKDNKESGRRKLLKSAVAGGGAVTVAKMLPDQWARPVVDTVMLPSHAQTSPPAESPFGPFISNGPIASADSAIQMAEQGFSEELLEFFTPAANAGLINASDVMRLTANESGDSVICSDWNASTNTTQVTVSIDNTTPPSFVANCSLGPLNVTGGVYVEGVWRVSVMSYLANSSTTVDLVPGGLGCDGGAPGTCAPI